MLIFQNKGLINLTALTTMGVNVKESETPIGVFGTGVKIAIAVVIRLGGTVTVMRGAKPYVFAAKRKEVRGKDFDLVTMNGRELGFTTHLGFQWEAWMAYREYWSNMHDEGGSVQKADYPAGQFVPKAGYTSFLIECAALDRVHDERHKVVLQTEPLVSVPGLEIHAGTSEFVFYHNIRVAKIPSNRRSRYTYNFTDKQSLTEDRTLQYSWMIPSNVVRGVIQCTNVPVLHDVLGTVTSDASDVKGTDWFEDHLPYAEMKSHKPSPQFMEVAEELHVAKKLRVGAASLFNEYKDTMPGYTSPYVVKPTEVEEHLVERALELVHKTGLRGYRRLDFVFKTKQHQDVSATAKGIIIKAEHLACGDPALMAAYMVEGLAQREGIASHQLALFLVEGKFRPDPRRSVKKSDEYGVEVPY